MSVRHVLGLETSGRAAGVCLLTLEGDREARCESVDLSQTGRRHARTLIPELKALLLRHTLRPHDVTAVGVSIGPGSFTGLRVGVACAKTLAWATGCAVFGIPTLEAVARQADRTDVTVLANAERGQLFVANFSQGCLGPIEIRDEDRLFADLSDQTPLTGPVPAAVRSRHAGHNWLPETVGRPQAETIARLTSARLIAGSPDDPYGLLPDYGRPSAAEEQRAAAG